MFELFIALFGGGYYGNKLLNEHIDHKEADNRRTEVKTRRDQWCSMVTDRALEEELRLFISRPENQDAVLAHVSEVYNKIFENNRIDELIPRWMWCEKKTNWSNEYHEEVQEFICRLNPTNALRIMMAKRGRLPAMDAITGSSMQLSFNTKLDAEVFAWCAEELRRNGLKEQFVIPNCYSHKIGWDI